MQTEQELPLINSIPLLVWDGVVNGILFSLTIPGSILGSIPGLILFSDRCLAPQIFGSMERITEVFLTVAGGLGGTTRFGEDHWYTDSTLEGHLLPLMYDLVLRRGIAVVQRVQIHIMLEK